MGLLDVFKENEQRHNATLINAKFLGGYDDRKKALGNLSFFNESVDFKVAFSAKASFSIAFSSITNVVVEGKDQVSRRVTVTRLITIGIFAFALQKKREEKDAYITLELKDGQEVIFHIKNKSPMEVRVALSKVIAMTKQSQA